MISIAKMHGAANDFVVVALAPPAAPLDAEWVRRVTDRRRGVGADGLLFLERLDGAETELRMHFYNCDGGRAGLCLNGARCVALRAVQLGWAQGRFGIATEHGTLEAEVNSVTEHEADVTLWIDAPSPSSAPIALPKGAPAPTGTPVHTGDPHLVLEVDRERLAQADFEDVARPLRWWKGAFHEGNNVHFVARSGNDWWIRSFERGIEGETLACGSGCISAVAALAPAGTPEVTLHVRSGDDLVVRPSSGPWQLVGPAALVFTCDVAGPATGEVHDAPA